MEIVFRTDASLDIGTGHVTRCLTLANALRKKGAKCRFICRASSKAMGERIEQERFEVVFLEELNADEERNSLPGPQLAHAGWLGTDWQTDADQTIAALGENRPDWLVVDYYALDFRWEIALRPQCGRIMVIDDLADRKHDCDLLLDQNLVENMERRYQDLVPENATCLLGPQYALLQSLYAELHPRTPPRIGPVKTILIYFGGADQQNLTGRAIEAFLALNRPDIHLDVVVNPGGQQTQALEQLVQNLPNITLYGFVPSLAYLMLKADLSIGAGGATSWERCCMGLPSIVITLADNQRPIAAEMYQQGLVHWLGDEESVSVSNLKEALDDIVKRKDALTEWSIRCRTLLEGKGAEQVTAILMLNAQTSLIARTARLDDEALILQWANDPLVRQNAFNSNKIDAVTHRNWFYNRLRNPEGCQIYIVETDLGLSIGQVRFEQSDGAWEIHYGLAAIARGRGLGVPLLSTAIRAFRQFQKGVNVFGRVKLENIPSQKIFEHLGFTSAQGEEYITYRLLL